jgi:hypothetical protein
MSTSKQKSKAQPIDKSILLEPNDNFITLLLIFYIGDPLKIVFHYLGMSSTNQKIEFFKVEDSIDHIEISFFIAIGHVAFFKDCMYNGLGNIVE